MKPYNVLLLVILRSTSLLSIVGSMILWILACIYRPWKLQIYKGDHMEIGVWTICRITPKVYQCYNDWYEHNWKWWFLFWRYLMVAGIAIQFLTFVYMVVEVARRPFNQLKPWGVGALGSITSAIFFFATMLIFYHKFEWEFAEKHFGWPVMGWNKETPDKPDYIETVGYPYIIAWVGEVWLFFTTFLCFYTAALEKALVDAEKLRILKEKAASGLPF